MRDALRARGELVTEALHACDQVIDAFAARSRAALRPGFECAADQRFEMFEARFERVNAMVEMFVQIGESLIEECGQRFRRVADPTLAGIIDRRIRHGLAPVTASQW
jgi:hypothetical protein